MAFTFLLCYILFCLIFFRLKALPRRLHLISPVHQFFFLHGVVTLFTAIRLVFLRVISLTTFLPLYYSRSELVWLDGFLFDFLQKKSADVWLRKFVINTGYIFSERMVFDQVVRLYLDNIIWPLHYAGSLETENVSEMLSVIIFLYFFFISAVMLLFIVF